MANRILRDSWAADVHQPVQTGPNTIEWQKTPVYAGVSLDLDELVKRLGMKALRSKGKKATAFYGALRLDIRERDAPTEGRE